MEDRKAESALTEEEMQELEDYVELGRRLETIGFTGDFFALTIPLKEALSLDLATLARKINTLIGTAQACADAIEARNVANNEKMMAFFNSTTASRFAE